MKTQMIWVTMLALTTIHCAKKESANTSQDSTPVVQTNGPFYPPYVGPGQNPGANLIYGGTAELKFLSAAVYREYAQRYISNLSQLSDVKINLNLNKYSNEAYGGTVTVRYVLNGVTYEGFFTSGDTSDAVKYNIWFTKNNNKVWHGLFEDFLGAIVVVIDGVASLGDGLSNDDLVSGSIWFKNFEPTPAPHPPTYCWFVSLGPYDCRAWKSGTGINTKQGPEPLSGDGYTKLGTFQDLDVNKAFNGELSL